MHQHLLTGFMRLHILHHAAEGPLYGGWMMEELRQHGYRISAGTLYPMIADRNLKISLWISSSSRSSASWLQR